MPPQTYNTHQRADWATWQWARRSGGLGNAFVLIVAGSFPCWEGPWRRFVVEAPAELFSRALRLVSSGLLHYIYHRFIGIFIYKRRVGECASDKWNGAQVNYVLEWAIEQRVWRSRRLMMIFRRMNFQICTYTDSFGGVNHEERWRIIYTISLSPTEAIADDEVRGEEYRFWRHWTEQSKLKPQIRCQNWLERNQTQFNSLIFHSTIITTTNYWLQEWKSLQKKTEDARVSIFFLYFHSSV